MPLLDLQKRLRTLGRIRTGVQVPTAKGKSRPAKLETFRLTSQSRQLIETAASVFGGLCSEWKDSPGDGPQWQVITKASSLDAIVPPASTLSQYWELWSGGGCQRRCDGETEILGERECMCPSDYEERGKLASEGKACKPTTRLNLILPQLPDIGVWRLETHSYYAAMELAGAQTIATLATARGHMIPVRLRLEPREIKRPGEPTKKFAVPVLEISATLGAVFEALGMNGHGPLMLGPDASLLALPAPKADDRLAQLGPGNASSHGGPGIEQGLARLGEKDPLRVPEPKGKQRRSAPMPGNPPDFGSFSGDGEPEIGSNTPDPEPGGEEPSVPMASKPQIKALQTIASKLGWTQGERHEIAGVEHFEHLSKNRARDLIDDWQEQLKAREDSGGAAVSRKAAAPSDARSGASGSRQGAATENGTAPVPTHATTPEHRSDGTGRNEGAGEHAPTAPRDTATGESLKDPHDQQDPSGHHSTRDEESSPLESSGEEGGSEGGRSGEPDAGVTAPAEPPSDPKAPFVNEDDGLADKLMTSGPYAGRPVSWIVANDAEWLRENLSKLSAVGKQIAEARLVGAP